MVSRRDFLTRLATGFALTPASPHAPVLDRLSDCLATGVPDLDSVIGGLPRGRVSTLCAPPRMGCTGVAIRIGDICANRGHRVAYVALEESTGMITTRRTAVAAQVDPHRLRTGRLSDPERARLAERSAVVNRHTLAVLDEPYRSVREIEDKLRDQPGDPSLVIVDHLEAIDAEDRAVAAEELAALARRTGAAFLLLAATRPPAEGAVWPQLQDIPRAVLRTADIVMALHRPSYFAMTSSTRLSEAYILVLRSRFGPTATVPLDWLPEHGTFRVEPTVPQ